MSLIKFGTDFEVAAIKPSRDIVPYLVPPIWLAVKEGAPILGWRDEKEAKEKGEKPIQPILIESPNGSWYGDGALFETDLPPTNSAFTLHHNALQARKELNKFLENYGLSTWIHPIARFDVELYVESEETTDFIKSCCVAGCSPDFDAIDSHYISQVRDLTHWPVRGLGAHLHMSLPEEYGDLLHRKRITAVRLLAIFVGNMAVYLNKHPEMERVRREQFGAPGRYRFPIYEDGSYGLEFRSLSSEWLDSPKTVECVISAANRALHILMRGDENDIRYYIQTFLRETTEAIKDVDKNLSFSILKDIGIL